MVALNIRHACCCPHRHALFAKVVILENARRAADRDFVVIADVIRCHAVRAALDAIAIAIVSVGRRDSADGDAGQPILGIIRQRIAAARTRAVR